MVKGLTDREVLTSYIITLSDNKCKEAYQILREHFDIKRPRMVKLNAEGVADPNGRVRLRQGELKKLRDKCGEYKFLWLVNTLHNYITDLEARAACDSNLRRRLKEYQRISHYYKMTKGWVAQKYVIEGAPGAPKEPKGLDFYSISSLEDARKYVASLPRYLRIDNPEIEYLVSKYPELITPEESEGIDG